jgi:adenylate cyclase
MISERTSGNPFFIEEMVQALFEQNVLARNGVVKLVGALSAAHLPVTVQGILASRIDRLPAAEKELLQMLAVIGRKQSLGLVRKVARGNHVEVERMLSDLRTGEFIYEEPALPDVEYRFKHALTQEVAYNSILAERRKATHEHIADAIGELFGDRIDEHLSETAYHYARSANASKAIRHLDLAARRAARRSTNDEAVAQFSTALQILEGLPRTPERDQQELDLLTGLGPVLMALKGFGAAECEDVYRRARYVCIRIGETPSLYTVLWGRWMSHSVQAKWDSALPLTRELMAIANNVRDPTLLLEAHHASWNTFIYRGELARAGVHVKEGLALYNPDQHQMLVSRYGGHDPGVCGYSHGSMNLWLQGNSDQSLGMLNEALALAQRLGHDHSYARAEDGAAWVYLFRREPRAAAEHARTALRICQKNGFIFWEAHAQMLLGWALGEVGQAEEGIALMRKGLENYRKTGALQHCGYFLLLLAERLSRAGRFDEGFLVLTEAAELLSNGERFHEAELCRVTAELLLQQSRANEEAAKAKLREAIKVSNQQGAKSWELRATTSLARLLAKQGRRDEARAMLAEIYSWFTEGFDTADLKDANALLDELAN